MLEFHVNNLYTRISKQKATREELLCLHKLLSVEVKGHYFSPQFRRGLWDGYKRFFNLLTCSFYSGLLGFVISKISCPYQVIDERKKIPHKNNSLELNGVTLRDYQIGMVKNAITKERGIISAPPNSGKTEVACGIVQVLGLPANFFTHRLTLLAQTRERISSRLGIKVGIVGGGEEKLEDVNILSVASIYKKLDEPKIMNLLKRTPVVISDECFTGNTRILIDTNISISIKDIYNSDISYVVSYNHGTNIIEKKKIVRKYKKLIHSKFYLQLTVKCGSTYRKICCTPNHKILSNSVYTRADELKIGDMVKFIDTDLGKYKICKKCGNVIRVGGPRHFHPSLGHKLYRAPKQIKCRKCDITFNTRSDFAGHHMKEHYMQTEKFLKNIKNAARIRGNQIFGKNNPSKDPVILEKIIAGRKKWWNSLPEEERYRFISKFQNGAFWNFFPTSLERIVIEFNILDLEYVGDGKFYRRFKNGRSKNPDFVYRKERKVIEIGDTIFWHTEKDLDEIKNGWEEIGYECLILKTEDFSTEKLKNLKGKIEKFLFNHEGQIIGIKKYSAKRSNYVYNLEVEDNHNYFAEGILVSNCHHIAAKTWEKCLKLCENSYYKYGLSATPLLRDDINNMLVRGLLGDEIISITNQELIKTGISALPSVFLLTISGPRIPAYYTFDQAYDDGILNNGPRNQLIISSAKRFLGRNKSVFILVWRIKHGQILKELFASENIEVEFISGEEKTTYIQDVLSRFKSRDLKCVISSTISDEGLDIPEMDVLILGVGFKAPLKTIQRVGRGLRRKTTGENVVSIIDFMDMHNRKYLYKHSFDRLKEYVKMGIEIFEVAGNDWDRIEKR